MPARARLSLIVLSVLLGSVSSASSAGGTAPTTPTINAAGSGPQNEAPDNKPKKDPLPPCSIQINKCLDDCDAMRGPPGARRPVTTKQDHRCEDACNSISPEGAGCKK
jgi:hypothetical protein